ncbi:hypothetical protein KO481_35495 [Nocardia sp. NEAU-G5]|uniref:PPE family domain-containing protein n=1 Tax=Nocardia albiluteola TaxID=2842303 RepID=A0ABS6BAN8_9NOCA|nr:hypothetical protein [Nocardia albiluteola]MBU3066811.1 hypothetical protein [Nocardia albiluteola]
MVLNVDPAELASVASGLANMATGTAAALPRGWVAPGGADPVSAQAVPVLNLAKAELANKVTDVLQHGVHGTAANIGASAADYSTADAEGGSRFGGSSGGTVANPVTVQGSYVRHVPPAPTTSGVEPVDPLTLAEQFHSGPGVTQAGSFADEVRNYLGGAHAAAHSHVTAAAQTVQGWQPVGEQVARSLIGHADSLDQLGGGLQSLIDGIDTYRNAFTTAKAAHPTPAEILATRRELLTAMRSKNPAALAEAMAKFEEQNALSAGVLANYATAVGVELGTTTAAAGAAGSDCGQGSGSGDTGSGSGAGASGGSGSGGGTPAGSGSGAGTTSRAGTSPGSGTSAAASSGDSSLMTSLMTMLPSLLSMGQSAIQQATQQNSGADSSDPMTASGPTIPDLNSLGAPAALGGGGGSIGDATAGAENIALGGLPMVGAASAMDSFALPAAAVTEPVTSAITAAEGIASGGAGGAGGMPYMPMMPGMGNQSGGAGGERNRVVAWHPDRLMYVDDTPHTEQVIGEKPKIAPTVTPATPVNQIPPQGGST